MLVDSHCHLDYFSQPSEQAEVIERARLAGVKEMVTIGVTLNQSRQAIEIAENHKNVWACAGVHPNHAADGPIATPKAIAALTKHPKVIGIGETGLDYFYDKAPKDIQQESFRAHIRAGQATGLPVAIHARDADDDIARILAEERAGGRDLPFLLHCFSSSRKLAEAAVEMGGYISFSGIITFPKSLELREIAGNIPLERILVETDSPYLAPVPFRGKRNEPAHTQHTARKLAEIKGLSFEEIAAVTTTNFRNLFRKVVLGTDS